MNFLLDNPIANLYGPYFLILYGILILFVLLFLSVVKYHLDTTDKLPTPPIPSVIDPFEIAYLRGGNNELVRTVIFSLYQKNFVDLEKYGRFSKITASIKPPHKSNLNEIESKAFEWLKKNNDFRIIFKENGLASHLQSFGEAYKTKLERTQLLTSGHIRNRFLQWKWFIMLSVASLALYKIIAALSHGKSNVLFTIILFGLGSALIYFTVKVPRISKLGKTYLERLEYTFVNLRNDAKKIYRSMENSPETPQTTFSGIDPLLLSVGIFGAGILAGTIFDNYNQVFYKSNKEETAYSNGSCSSGCGSSSCSMASGSSCSSGASSCSSGSSCGGGGCGGGCGG